MKVLALADPHASDRPPSSCTSSYRDDILDLLVQSVEVAAQHQVSAAVWAGDIFHLKAPGRTSHWLVAALADIVRSYPCPVYIVPGNHDIRYDRIDSIDGQPLGVLYRAGARQLIGRCPEFPQLYGVPWLQEHTEESVSAALDGWRNDDFAGHSSAHLVVAHAPLFPPGAEPPWESFPAAAWASAMGNRGSCFYGHIHEYHGTWETGGVQFCNNGAISRGSLHESEMTRDVLVTVWDSMDGSFRSVKLDAKPAAEVFRLREHQEVTDATGKLEEFMASIGSASLEVLSVEAVLAHISRLGLDPADEREVSELLEWAAHSG